MVLQGRDTGQLPTLPCAKDEVGLVDGPGLRHVCQAMRGKDERSEEIAKDFTRLVVLAKQRHS